MYLKVVTIDYLGNRRKLVETPNRKGNDERENSKLNRKHEGFMKLFFAQPRVWEVR